MTIFLVLVLIIAAIIAGCATLNPGLGSPPKLGEYNYTHAPKYLGSPLREIPVWIDNEFGAADKVEIDKALDSWNYAMNGYIKLTVVDTHFDMEVDKIVTQVKLGGWLFMKIKSDSTLVPTNDKGFWTIGFCEVIGGHHMYLVRDRLGNDDIFGVTLHEIGHLMGSGHVGQRLMYPHYTRARFQCIDYQTMTQVSKFFGLPMENLNYCLDGFPVMEEASPDGGPIMSNCPMKE